MTSIYCRFGPGAYTHGPGLEAALQEGAVDDIVKPHKHLSLWLASIGLESSVSAVQLQGTLLVILVASILSFNLQAMFSLSSADVYFISGFQQPSALLPFLLDVDAYDSFAEDCGLRAKDARILWSALGKSLVLCLQYFCFLSSTPVR